MDISKCFNAEEKHEGAKHSPPTMWEHLKVHTAVKSSFMLVLQPVFNADKQASRDMSCDSNET